MRECLLQTVGHGDRSALAGLEAGRFSTVFGGGMGGFRSGSLNVRFRLAGVPFEQRISADSLYCATIPRPVWPRGTRKSVGRKRHPLLSSASLNMLGKYSIGMGDRFAHQAAAQLRACILAREAGTEI